MEGFSYNVVYRALGIRKQAVAQWLDRKDIRNELLNQLELIVRDVREEHPGMGLRFIYETLEVPEIGRDRFEKYFKEIGYGVKRGKSYTRTTDSRGVTKFENLTQDIELKKMDQLWVSDITYFAVGNKFYYLTFILDAFTRRIVGHSVASSLLTEQTTLPALEMAFKARKYGKNNKPLDLIFHSDGGGQYYSKTFIKSLRSLNIKSSMAETVYENSKAERINGVIKNNYLAYWNIKSFKDLEKYVDRAVQAYNFKKPHTRLKLQTPISFEQSLLTLHCQKQTEDEQLINGNIRKEGHLAHPFLSQKKPQTHNLSLETQV